jgi:UDP-N-acetylglucosamine diphosphorylase / glucose-1-phosphate thymidylyltransferase / UDP-N-acetylgalactosamine diphosphorylase / glucosamine-1-phosphate N-acetyltransferase / galactosamine-1-phosphate N-acetyltransferase
MINIVIPMAGLGSRFVSAGYKKPKPFIDVGGVPMIIKVLRNLNYPGARYILVARREHIELEFNLVEKIKQEFNAVFIPIDSVTEGTACTVLFARKYINNDAPLLIANSDQLVDIKIEEFIDDCTNRDLNGSILSFIDKDKNPKWSFAKTDGNGFVTQVKEKDPISEVATVGVYMFNRGSLFVNGAIDMIIENDRSGGEFYTCPVYNYLIRDGFKIGIYNIDELQMHGLGTPSDLKKYLRSV